MKHLTRRMKKAAPLAVLGLLLLDHSPVNPTAQALVGGPFDDNSYPGSNADGTYSGTLTGPNLIGIVTFGVSASTETNGRFSVFHEGFVHYGAAAGIADLASRRVAGSLLGVASLPGETTGGSGSPASAGQAITVRSGVEGTFHAKMKGYPQQITFEGEGELASNANAAVLTSNTDPNVNPDFTVFLDNLTTAAGSPGNVFGNTADAVVNGSVQRTILRASTPFKVRGSRTSRSVFSPLNSYSSIAPLTLTSSGSIATPAATPVIVVP